MSVTVKLFATFQRGRFAIASRDYAPGTTIEQIAMDLAIPVAEIGVIMVNSRHAELDYRPEAGDTIAIFPVIGGG